jgi:hypothetical protein
MEKPQPRFISFISISFFFTLLSSIPSTTESKCTKGCPLALASFYAVKGSNLTYISRGVVMVHKLFPGISYGA